MKIILTILGSVISISCFPQGIWNQKANVGFTPKSAAVSFTIGGIGYIGTGADSIVGLSKSLWAYDPSIDVWTQRADMNSEYGRRNAVGFAIGNFGYIGTGDLPTSDHANDFKQYDPELNKWTSKAKYPGSKRQFATGFCIGEKGYIGSGSNSNSGWMKDYYEYDPATDTWTQIADLPGAARIASLGFSIGSKGYVAFGSKSSGMTNELWEYDPAVGEWILRNTCPGASRYGAVGFVIEDKVYTGTGLDDIGNYLSDFWQYDQATDSWEQIESLPGDGRYFAVGLAIGDKGYVGIGQQGVFDPYLNDFWEFTPGCEVPGNPTTTNISSQSAKLKWDVVGGATKYRVQYREDASGAPWVSKMVNASKTAITINGLAANTAYKWKVRSVCDQEQSDYSLVQTFTTLLRLGDEAGDLSALAVYPNPMSTTATLSFSLAADANTTIQVFDLAGRKTELLDEILSAGEHRITLSRKQLGEGVFLVKFITGNQISVIKVIVQ